MANKVTIELPRDLCEAVEKKYIGERFKDMNALIEYLLEQIIDDEALRMDEDERELLEQRMRDLGYI